MKYKKTATLGESNEKPARREAFAIFATLGVIAAVCGIYGAKYASCTEGAILLMVGGLISGVAAIYCIYNMIHDCYRDHKHKRRNKAKQPQTDKKICRDTRGCRIF